MDVEELKRNSRWLYKIILDEFNYNIMQDHFLYPGYVMIKTIENDGIELAFVDKYNHIYFQFFTWEYLEKTIPTLTKWYERMNRDYRTSYLAGLST